MYMLDTNIVSHAVRDAKGVCAGRLSKLSHDEVSLSVIVAAELLYGLAKNPSIRWRASVEMFLVQFRVLPFEPPANVHYAEIRAELSKRGKTVGANDLLIAAHALSLGAILVTDDTSEFSRVPGLAVENWLRQ